MAKKFLAGIDLQNREAKNFVGEKLDSAPSSPVEGREYFNTTTKDKYFWNGTEWKSASGSVYTLPKAAADVLGGVQIGDNIQVDSANGKISVFDATNAQKGVIQIATDAEATAGTDEAKAINSKQLKIAADAAQAAAESAINTKVGVANGIASLDANAKIPTSQLPDQIVGQMLLGGSFDGSGVATISSNLQKKLGISDSTIQLINSATDDTSTSPKQYGYKSLEGVYFLADATFEIGGVTFEVGDWLVGFGTKWAKIDNTDAVVSVAGRTGAVTLTKADVGLDNVDNTSDVNKPVSTAQQTALDAKLNKDFGTANAGKPLVVGADGIPSAGELIHVVDGAALGINPDDISEEKELTAASVQDIVDSFFAGKVVLINVNKSDGSVKNTLVVTSATKDVNKIAFTCLSCSAINATAGNPQPVLETERYVGVLITGQTSGSWIGFGSDFKKRYSNEDITPAGGIATWSLSNIYGTDAVSVSVYDASGSEVEMDVKVTESEITLSWNADANVAAGTYFAVIAR